MLDGQAITYASRSMAETETNYVQIEREMLAIVFAVERFGQYVYSRPVLVQADHRPLEVIYKKSLTSAPKRLQRMLLRLQTFDLTVTYKKGSEMVLADTLSRAYGSSTSSGETEQDAEAVYIIQYLPVSEETQTAIQNATESDDTLRELKSTIRLGWPLTKDVAPVSVGNYFPFRDKLTLQNGIIFKGERIVIPSSLRSDMMAKIHASHIAIQGCLRRARKDLYWPGINKEIEEYVARCETCNNYHSEKEREPMIGHELPTRPWEKVAVDIFELDQKNFLVTVNYYSSFFEVDRITTKTAREVINKIKPHFSRHGIPDTVVSDNGQLFASSDFQEFTNLYRFEYVTSSPGNPQSNGKVENAVSTANKLMRKGLDTKNDPYLALLDWRNTPSEMLNSSPSQRIFGRRTKTLLPTSSKLLRPKVPDVDQKLKLPKTKQSFHYNEGTRELQELKPGDTVRVQPMKLGKKNWVQAQVDEKVDISSYHLRTEYGSVYRRNRRHLQRTQETPKTKAEELPDKVCPEEPTRANTYPQSTPPSITPTTVKQRPATGTSTTPVVIPFRLLGIFFSTVTFVFFLISTTPERKGGKRVVFHKK